MQWSNSLNGTFGETNQSELAAFTSYALAFPDNFLALVDTYDVSKLRVAYSINDVAEAELYFYGLCNTMLCLHFTRL